MVRVSIDDARAHLHARLQARRHEIDQAVLTRVCAVSDPAETSDPEYADGLRAAVHAALDYGLAAIERSEERPPAVPAALLTQARAAVRSGVHLDIVLRRYFAGYALLGDFLIGEAEKDGFLNASTLKRLLRTQATVFDRLLAVISAEYAREAEERLGSSAQRRAERIRRLLDGELIDTLELNYDFNAFHLGLIASGPEAAETIRDLAAGIDCRLLVVGRAEATAWAWLGSRRGLDPGELERLVALNPPNALSLAIGEPGQGLAGWRLTHKQAAAALPIARRSQAGVVRYADVALLASMCQDDLLATSLRELYLRPLEGERDGGEVARETLRAYFDTGRNVSSAAATLGVSRQAVTSRLHVIAERLGRPLDSCAAELEAALHLEELGEPILTHRAPSPASQSIPAGGETT
jgi:hypothetical protein